MKPYCRDTCKHFCGIRPILSGDQRITASFYKNRNASTPFFTFTTRGGFRFDLVRVLTLLWMGVTFLAVCRLRREMRWKRRFKAKYKHR